MLGLLRHGLYAQAVSSARGAGLDARLLPLEQLGREPGVVHGQRPIAQNIEAWW